MAKFLSFYRGLIYKNRYWIYFVLVLAVVWGLAGLLLSVIFPGGYEAFIRSLEKIFAEALGSLEFESNFDLASAIFQQNLLATIYDLFLGVFFGLVPVFSIMINFFTLGFLSGPAVAPSYFASEGVSLLIFLVAILPHGIFELPAIFLAAAFGMRLGWEWLFPSSSGKRIAVFKKSLIDCGKIFPLIFVLLVIAALVEVYVTGWILGV